MARLGSGLAALLAAAAFLAATASSQPPGGKEGKGGPPRFELGQVIPPPLRAEMNLTPEQEKQLDALKTEMRARLSRILTPEQVRMAENFRPRLGGGAGGEKGGKGVPGGEKGEKGAKGPKGGQGEAKGGRPARPPGE